MNAYTCRPSRALTGHTFDPTSGYCVHGCGVRDDGRVVDPRTGRTIVPAPPEHIDITEPRHAA